MKSARIAAVVLIVAIGALYGYQRLTAPRGGERAVNLPTPSEPALSGSLTREVDLFFSDSSGRRLALERREVTGAGSEGLLKAVVEEVVKGPVSPDRTPTLPETVQVRAVYSREDTVWVDLASSIVDEHPGGAWTEVLTVYSIVNTITENFPEFARVQILVDGRERDTLAGHVDISGPLAGRIQLLAGEWE